MSCRSSLAASDSSEENKHVGNMMLGLPIEETKQRKAVQYLVRKSSVCARRPLLLYCRQGRAPLFRLSPFRHVRTVGAFPAFPRS